MKIFLVNSVYLCVQFSLAELGSFHASQGGENDGVINLHISIIYLDNIDFYDKLEIIAQIFTSLRQLNVAVNEGL